MQRILLPTDFSENSWNAIEYAFDFFEGHSLDFHILHVGFSGRVESTDDLYLQGIALPGIISKGIQSKFDKLLKKIRKYFPNHTHNLFTHYEANLFIESVRKIIKTESIDMIIMGTKGASHIKGVTLGSHAGSVITRVKCPTFVIPEKATFENPESIAFPTDFNMMYKDRILQTLKQISGYHDSSIKVLRVAVKEGTLENEQLKNKDYLSDALYEIPHSFHWIQNPELEKGLQTFIDLMEIKIIAMVGKNLNFFQRLLFKPTIAKISYHTKIPFLVLHE